MRRRFVTEIAGAIGAALLLLPAVAPAQEGGLRNRVGAGDRGLTDRGGTRGGGWSRDRTWSGDRTWSRRSRSHDWGFRGSFGVWLGPTWDSLWWGWPWYGAPYSYGYDYPYGYAYRSPYRYGYPVYPDRYYAPPPVVVQPPQPYPEAAEPDEPGAWYFCEDPKGYYPYVRECPGGWTSVPATPDVTPPPAAAPPPPPEGTAPPAAAVPPGPVPEEYRWYYCRDPEGYYPYVQDCPSGWQETSPAPPPGR